MILDLTDATLNDSTVPRDGLVLVVFHKEGCPGCVSLKPQIERLAALYPNVPVLRLLLSDNQLSQMKWEVKQVPDVYLVKRENGQSIGYSTIAPTMLNLAFTMAAGGS